LINEEADHPYGWDAPGVTYGKLASMYYLFGSIFREKGYAVGEEMIKTIDNLLDKLLPMIPSAKERAKTQGLAMKDQTEMFVLGGGINYGLAYQFAVCTLMEMCWVHARARLSRNTVKRFLAVCLARTGRNLQPSVGRSVCSSFYIYSAGVARIKS
jgi:fructoselysine-6-P-deglycase FrlB-like protein